MANWPQLRVLAALMTAAVAGPAHAALDFDFALALAQQRSRQLVAQDAAAQSARDVIFSAAFPNFEFARRADPAFAGIEAQHDFAE